MMVLKYGRIYVASMNFLNELTDLTDLCCKPKIPLLE